VVWVGDIDDQRLDPRRTDGVCVPVASNTREDVEPPARQFACRGRAVPVDAPVMTAISWLSYDGVISMNLSLEMTLSHKIAES
jgi:hypothetical protein